MRDCENRYTPSGPTKYLSALQTKYVSGARPSVSRRTSEDLPEPLGPRRMTATLSPADGAAPAPAAQSLCAELAVCARVVTLMVGRGTVGR